MNKRTIYHIEFAKNGDIAASGGEVCMLENIKYFVSRGEKNCVFTTKKGKKAFLDWGLQESEFLNFKIIDTEDPNTRLKLLLNYCKRIFLAKKLIKNINFSDNDIVFCHSDFFPNSLPLYWISKKNRNVKFMCYFHMLYPSIFRGYEGEFINRYKFPEIGMIYLKLNQGLYLNVIKKIEKGYIIAVNSYYSFLLEKKFNKQNIYIHYLKLFGGVNIPEIKNKEKKYDIVWMGRFHKQKGIEELFDIVQKLKEKEDNIKVLVIGGGNKESENNFKEKIKDLDLEKNIDYKGFLNGKERFEYMCQAKIFSMTSYFEGRPIVMLESLKMGLPIVSYDLPVYKVYDRGIIKVPILDNDKFAEKILFLLKNPEELFKYSEEAKELSKDYSWENTGKEIYNLF